MNAVGAYTTHNVTIPASGSAQFDTDCDELLITELSGGSGLVQLALNHGPPGEAWKGFEATGQIRHVQITNPSASFAVTVQIAQVTGLAVRDRRVSVVGGAVPVIAAAYASFTSLADVTLPAGVTTLLFAADATRLVAVISNPASNPREVRLGDASAGAAQGHELVPGERFDLPTTAEIYAYNPHGGAMTLARLAFGS